MCEHFKTIEDGIRQTYEKGGNNEEISRVNRLLLDENATYKGSEGFGSDILRGLLTDYCSGKFILWPRAPFSDASWDIKLWRAGCDKWGPEGSSPGTTAPVRVTKRLHISTVKKCLG